MQLLFLHVINLLISPLAAMQSNFDIKHLDAVYVLFIARPCRDGRWAILVS